MSGELSQFEQQSAITPKQMPFGMLGGLVLALIIIGLINTFGKNEAVDDLDKLKGGNTAAETAPAAAPAKNEAEAL